MANRRRPSAKPPPELPEIQFRPGLADETLRELAPLLAEDGIDVNDIDVPDLDTLNAALQRAVERHNMARFTPVGPARDHVVGALRQIVEAIAADTTRAADLLDQVPPEAPDPAGATVAGCIGVALGLLDDWLSGHDPHPPRDLADRVRLPAEPWPGMRAATDILVLARKGPCSARWTH